MGTNEVDGRPQSEGGPGRMRILVRGAARSLAVAAILLAAWEGLENRRHNRLSVQPRIDGASQVADLGGMWTQSFRFASAGLGPGQVTDFRVYWHGEEIWNDGARDRGVSGPWQPVFDQLEGRYDLTASPLGIGSVLRVGEDYDVLIVRQRSPGSIDELLDATRSIGVVLCYCSLYEDQCRASSIGAVPEGVSLCGAGGA